VCDCVKIIKLNDKEIVVGKQSDFLYSFMPKFAADTRKRTIGNKPEIKKNFNRFFPFCQRDAYLLVIRNVTVRDPKEALTAEPHETGHKGHT
jgi:hypothetical protein